MIAATPGAIELMCRGAVALSAATAQGIRVDVPYLDRTIDEVAKQIATIDDELRQTDEYKAQERKFGASTKLTSDDQIIWLLFDHQGHEPLSYTSGSATREPRPQLNDPCLRHIGTPYCMKLLSRRKLDKLHGTYLQGIKRETVDGFIHPNFPLHRAVTYRGASADPNWTNMPIRNKVIAKYLRTAFIPSRPDHVLLEIDLKQNEVRVSACYSQDEKLIYDTLHGDMHRDMAMECFMLEQHQVSKAVRNEAKGDFVFAEFYGSYYPDVARKLWHEAAKLKIEDGTPLLDHLASQGITERGDCSKGERRDPLPGSFEAHIKRVEQRFWAERFKKHDDWRKQWWNDYLKNGYFQMLSGFVVTFGKSGPLGRNDSINSPSQGSAFHALLWGFIRLGDWLRKNKMRSKLVGQIHDAITLDCHKDEWREVAAKAYQLLVVDIRKAWPWLVVPLDIEVELCEQNWFEKRPVEFNSAV